jgi:hypothetical protein
VIYFLQLLEILLSPALQLVNNLKLRDVFCMVQLAGRVASSFGLQQRGCFYSRVSFQVWVRRLQCVRAGMIDRKRAVQVYCRGPLQLTHCVTHNRLLPAYFLHFGNDGAPQGSEVLTCRVFLYCLEGKAIPLQV